MNNGKKKSWQLAAVTAAALLSGTVLADGRSHDRVWREHGASNFDGGGSDRHHYHGYVEQAWHRNHRYQAPPRYWSNSHRHYGYEYVSRYRRDCPPSLRYRSSYWSPQVASVRVVVRVP